MSIATRPVASPASASSRWRRRASPSWTAASARARTLGVAVGTEHGDFRSSEEFAAGFLRRGPAGLSPMIFPNTVMNSMAAQVAIAVGAQGPTVTVNQATVPGDLAVARAAALVASGQARHHARRRRRRDLRARCIASSPRMGVLSPDGRRGARGVPSVRPRPQRARCSGRGPRSSSSRPRAAARARGAREWPRFSARRGAASPWPRTPPARRGAIAARRYRRSSPGWAWAPATSGVLRLGQWRSRPRRLGAGTAGGRPGPARPPRPAWPAAVPRRRSSASTAGLGVLRAAAAALEARRGAAARARPRAGARRLPHRPGHRSARVSDHLIVIPVFDEATTIGAIAGRAQRHGALLVVDDGSGDGERSGGRCGGGRGLAAAPAPGQGRRAPGRLRRGARARSRARRHARRRRAARPGRDPAPPRRRRGDARGHSSWGGASPGEAAPGRPRQSRSPG